MEREKIERKEEKDPIHNPKKYQVFIGSIHPSIQYEEIVDFFLQKGFDVELNKSRSRINKRFCILRLSSLNQYQRLLKVNNRVHHIRNYKIEVEEYLKGDKKNTRNSKILKKKLYVGNLPNKVSDQELKSFFSQFGNVKAAYVKNRASKKKFKFGFVEFFHENDAKKILKMKKIKFQEKSVFIREFKLSRKLDSESDDSNKGKKVGDVTKSLRLKFPQEMLEFNGIEREISPLRSSLLKSIHERQLIDDDLLRFRKSVGN